MTPEESAQYGFSTRAIHAGQRPDPTTGALMTPVYQNSTYGQPAPNQPVDGYEYSRTKNPTRLALEHNLAALEGSRYGLAFGSGMAAINTLLNLTESGDHIVAGDDLYGGTWRLFEKVYRKYGVEFTFVDFSDLAAVQAAMRPNTRVVYAETPTNPLLKICDLQRVAEIATAGNALAVCDNTFATPCLQRPLSLGFDIVVHSTTKYIGGHSDVIGGALVSAKAEVHEKLAFYQNSVGAVPGPMDCFLTLRGTKTLAVRMDRHCDNARRIADFLAAHDQVESVLYPGLTSHPGHAIAARQMSDFGGMISFVLRGSLERAMNVTGGMRLFACAESLGGVESLVEHPPSMTHASVPVELRHAAGMHDGLIRLSVGIEDCDDLQADIAEAIAAN